MGDPTDDALARVPLFGGLSRRQRRRVAALATRLEIPPRSVLVEEGNPGSEFVVVISGSLEVTRAGVVVGTLGEGDYFGETALLEHRPRNASVRAVTPAVVEVVGSADFHQLCIDSPRIEAALRRSAAAHAPTADPTAGT